MPRKKTDLSWPKKKSTSDPARRVILIEVLRDFRNSDNSYVIYDRLKHGNLATVMKDDMVFRGQASHGFLPNGTGLVPTKPVIPDYPEWSPALYKKKIQAKRAPESLEHESDTAAQAIKAPKIVHPAPEPAMASSTPDYKSLK